MLIPSSELEKLKLNYGMNRIQYSIDIPCRTDKRTEKNAKIVYANVFLWQCTDKIVITDIDGTITKSDIRGKIFLI